MVYPGEAATGATGSMMTVAEQATQRTHYSMLIEWSDEDNAYIATVRELSGCMTHGSTYAEAVRQGEDAIATWLDRARASGDPIPPPRLFSGQPAPGG